MSEFYLWFTTGLQHILDIYGFDHILYIMVLCAAYTFREWRKLLVLVTAFTIGHSLTLACSAFGILTVKQGVIEIFIPLTIIFTCLYAFLNRHKTVSGFSWAYILALGFGFIHGLGFSYLLRSMLGHEENVLLPLFSFNLGLEAGQLVVVGLSLCMSAALDHFFSIKKPVFITILSTVVLLIAGYVLYNRINDYNTCVTYL
ncbi:MAG: HupE/UreJ family protein [Bacteroidetes bacterium]|nr:HupE/UreJ family protein [Bacteroidota bacterium]